MGNATRAEVDMPPSPLITELKGNSEGKPERGGIVLLNKLGVVSDIMGVVKESFLLVVERAAVAVSLATDCLSVLGGVSISIKGGGVAGVYR